MLYFTDERQPFEYTELPAMSQLVDDLEWDVLCLFDAGRWDFYNTFFTSAEPTRSPGSTTSDWITNGIMESTADWSDVTYVHSDRDIVRKEEGTDGYVTLAENDHLGEVVNSVESSITQTDTESGQQFTSTDKFQEAYRLNPQILKSRTNGVADPNILTEFACDVAEPPIVIHYQLPDNPILGESTVTTGSTRGDAATQYFDHTLFGATDPYALAKENHISSDMLRLIYYHNYLPAFNASRKLDRRFERVIWTADHGQHLGPTEYYHETSSTQTRTVPFEASWDAPVDSPQQYGGGNGHEWRHLD